MIRKSDLRSLAKSFVYAWHGVAYCIKNERNMRIHLSMVVLVSYFSYFYKITRQELVSVLFCFGIVIVCEALNTAIEALVNLGSPQYNNFARVAKDVAAGAVLVAAISSAIIGIIIFSDLDRLGGAFIALFTNIVFCAVFIVLLILAVIFIFNGPRMFGEKTTRIYHIHKQ